jgi:hypothetical protein
VPSTLTRRNADKGFVSVSFITWTRAAACMTTSTPAKPSYQLAV